MTLDPVVTNPEHYKVVFENERVRVLEYRDRPGDQTTPHERPDTFMYTLSSFRRRLISDDAIETLSYKPERLVGFQPSDTRGTTLATRPATRSSSS